jgi:hypothetical protein
MPQAEAEVGANAAAPSDSAASATSESLRNNMDRLLQALAPNAPPVKSRFPWLPR